MSEYMFSLDNNSNPTQVLPFPTRETLEATMQSIDQVAIWLESTGLSSGAIAQWKYNCLATAFPALGNLAESAKSLIATTMPIPDAGMNVTEVATILSESLERKIKPADVNKALVELGLQVRKERERVWELTEAGRNYGEAFLATSKTNTWAGAQVKWFKSVIPFLEEYFQSQLDPNGQSEACENKTSLTTEKAQATDERKFWFIEERIKHLRLKSNASQRMHIEMYVVDAYKARHDKIPGKQLFKNGQATAIPVADLDLLDESIKKFIASTNGSLQSSKNR